MRMVLPVTLREAIAEAIAGNVKSYDVPAVCVGLGLAPGEDSDAFRSKRYMCSAGCTTGRLANSLT